MIIFLVVTVWTQYKPALATADTMQPDDIDKVANAVLAIQLPRSPDEIKKMIKDIQNIMVNFTHVQDDLKPLLDQAKLATIINQKAEEILYVHQHSEMQSQ